VGRAHRLAARRRTLLRFERDLWERGVERVAGVDEAGVGPLAGPLVAAAVVLPREAKLKGVDDSKKLRAACRERLAADIEAAALGIGVGIVEVEEVDRLNVFWAAIEAMRRAVRALPFRPDQLLVDARHIPGLGLPQLALVGGDARSCSIAAASIVAKVRRDAMMLDLDSLYPQYGFARHKGYGTRAHLVALERHGPCPVHRRSFAPVRQARLPGF
jgi:ribonuclease HII